MPELTDFEKQDELESETGPEEIPGFSDISDDVKDSLKTILDLTLKSEEFYRHRQLRGLKRNNLFWQGYTNIVWNGPNDLSGDWVSVSDALRSLGSDELKVDPSLYDETVAIYRAYGEAIVGALTVTPPSVRFFPQNAEESNDIRTASAYSRISKKIQSDNKVEVIMPEIVKTLCNEGMVGVYNYTQYDSKYGVVTRDVYGQEQVKVEKDYCPNCQALLNVDAIKEESQDLSSDTNLTDSEVLQQPLKDEFGPDGLLVDPNQTLQQPPQQEKIGNCPECGYQGPLVTESYSEEQPVKKDTRDIPKCRQILEVYGALQIQISQFADKPQDVGFLILYSESNYAQARSLFPWIREKIIAGSDEGNYYRWSRTYNGYFDEEQSQCTVRRVWFKPWMYELINDEDKREELNEKFPDGVYVVYINDEFAQAFSEDMDECWSLTLHPLSDRIYADPLLKFTLPIQRMVDDVVNLTIQTIKFGVSPIFADPRYFNFEKWGQTQALPGAFYEVSTPPSGKIADAFHSIKPATLSREVDDFMSRLDFFGQFMSGAFPTIYGGGNAGTLGQDQQNKQQALQRLALAWTVVKNLWATVMSKAVKNFSKQLLEDESFSEKIGNSYINSVIRLEDLTGEIGEVSPETSEQFPESWAQKRTVLMELLTNNNPGVQSILGSTQNLGVVKNLIGLPEIYVPGDDQRNKQLDEISQLIVSEPMMNPMTGMMTSSVPIEPQVDIDEIHLETCQAFATSEQGMDLKRFNPAGYQNVLAHAAEHQMNIQLKMQQMMEQQAQQEQMNNPQDQNTVQEPGA